MSKLSRILFLLTAFAVVHCADRMAGGAGAGNPPLAVVALALRAGSVDTLPSKALGKTVGAAIRNADGTFTIRDSAGAAITLTAITVLASRIDFILPDSLDCDDAKGTDCQNKEVSVRGAFSLDLMTGKSVPDSVKIRVPEGLYKQVGIDLQESAASQAGKGGFAKASARGDQDTSASNMLILGRTDSSIQAVKRFALKLNLREGLDFVNPAGLQLRSDSLNTILVQLAVDDWLKGIDLGKCLDTTSIRPDADGVWNLEGDGSCGGAGLRARRNIEASGEINKGEPELP